jgi:hypothetical protein
MFCLFYSRIMDFQLYLELPILSLIYSNAQTSFIMHIHWCIGWTILYYSKSTHIFQFYLWGWVTLKQIIL